MLLNFGGASPFWQQLRRPFALAGSVKSAALVRIERGRWWAEVAARARWRVRDAAARWIAPIDPQAAAIVTAILIGDRGGLDDDLIHHLQIAGTYHVIAISGGNVALLTGLCFGILRLLVRAPRVVAVLTLIVTLVYGAIVGGDPSVARAVTAAAIVLLAGMAGMVPSPLATLRTVACLLAIVDPLVVVDVSAWLSFGATLGILVVAGPLLRLVPWSNMPRGIRVAIQPVAVLIAATIAAELMLLPVSAAVFGRVTSAGLILNLMAIPAMGVVQIAGLTTVLIGPAFTLVGTWSAWIAAKAAHVLVWSTGLVDAWPWLSWRVPAAPLIWIGIYYASALGLWWMRDRHVPRRIAWAAAGVALGVIVFAPSAGSARPIAGRLRVSLIDVGQGDAILVQLPNGEALLVDAGGAPGSFDIGGRVVTPALWALGVRRLTWFTLTHPDLDHIGGAVSVTEDLSPREIWEGVPVPRDRDLRRIREFADARGIAWREVRTGALLSIGPRLTVEVASPPEPEWERQKSRNDDSVVLRIRYGNVDVLLTGDAGAEFETRLPADLAASPIRILKAGHHGSRTSTSDRLVQAMRPQIALISVGRGNVFGQPAPEVIDRLTRAGARIFRTDQDGAVSLETDGRSVRVLTALGRSWQLAVVGPA
jgi:competence protein ComEC